MVQEAAFEQVDLSPESMNQMAAAAAAQNNDADVFMEDPGFAASPAPVEYNPFDEEEDIIRAPKNDSSFHQVPSAEEQYQANYQHYYQEEGQQQEQQLQEQQQLHEQQQYGQDYQTVAQDSYNETPQWQDERSLAESEGADQFYQQ